MKKVMVTPGITDLNRGDQALIWLIRDLVELENEEVEFLLLQSGNNEEDILKQSKQSMEMGFEVISPILLHPARGKEKKKVEYSLLTKISWGLTSIKDMFKSGMLLSKKAFIKNKGIKYLNEKQRDSYEEFKKIDLLIVKGGGFLHTYNRLSDLYYLYYSLFNLMLAKNMNKKVIIMPNSFGPFMGKIEKWIIKKVLSDCELIYARESISQRYLSEVINKDVNIAPDLGFYIKTNNYQLSNKKLEDTNTLKKIAITMRPYRFPESKNGEEKYKSYIEEMYKTVSQLISKNYFPVFVAHTLGPSAHEDDRIAIEQVIELLEENDITNKEYTYVDDEKMNCYDITNLYSQVDYIIGTRFHSVIFAMASKVPAIAIAYSGNKTQGIMDDMGLGEYTVDISDIRAEDIINKFENMINNEDNIKGIIEEYLNDANQKKRILAKEFNKLLKD